MKRQSGAILAWLAPAVWRLGGSLLAVAFAFLVAGALVRATGGQPLASFGALWQGACGTQNDLLRSLARSTPLLFAGLGVALALRAGLFNIGAEGQLLIGGFAAAAVGWKLAAVPGVLLLPLCLVAGMAAGGLWGLVPGALKAWRDAHEVIVSIMMNYIAIQLTHWLVNGPLHDPATMAPATGAIAPGAELWAMGPAQGSFSAGFFLALAAAAAAAFLLRRTAFGFELRTVGQEPAAARAAGVNVARVTAQTMALSGALAGLAGAVEVLAVHHRFYSQFSPGYGYDSLAVALLGGTSPGGVVLASVLFGALDNGARMMEGLTLTPPQVAGIVQGVVVLAVAIRFGRRRRPAR